MSCNKANIFIISVSKATPESDLSDAEDTPLNTSTPTTPASKRSAGLWKKMAKSSTTDDSKKKKEVRNFRSYITIVNRVLGSEYFIVVL